VICPRASVSASFSPTYFYIEAPDRSWGICVLSAGGAALPVGAEVSVSGKLKTNALKERYIEASSVQQTGTLSVAPLGMLCANLGGADFRYNAATGSGQSGAKGVEWGVNTVGLLVTIVGRVEYVYPTGPFFTVSDGSRNAGTLPVDVNGKPGMMVWSPTPIAGTVAVGDLVSVTGVISLMTDLHPLLRARQPDGIRVLD